jgi:hypothetical protein
MRKCSQSSKRNCQESGYALLLAVFLTTLLLIATIVAVPSVRTERQRDKEQEMIWRGKQYVRAIKLYYRKNGRFPTTLDDLIKPKMGSLRYLRQAYKDPMNKEDGTWRLIYVGPAGQLIGSMKPPQALQFPGAAGGAQPGTPTSGLGGFGSTQGANGTPPQGVAGSQLGGATGTAQQGAASGTPDGATPQNPSSPAPVDTSTFVGGNIIGIGSKATKDSIIVYEKAKNYHLFEFIWDPSKDTMTIGGAGTQMGTPAAPGQNPNQGFGQGTFGNQPSQSPPVGIPAPAQPGMPPLTPNGPPQ